MIEREAVQTFDEIIEDFVERRKTKIEKGR
jgi:hypothetical protein